MKELGEERVGGGREAESRRGTGGGGGREDGEEGLSVGGGKGFEEEFCVENEIRQEIFNDVYSVEAEIGRGKFAVVKRCTHKQSGQSFAAKFVHKRRKGCDVRAEALREVRMLRQAIVHPRIIKLVEVYESCRELIIVTEYVRGGELFGHIDVEGRIEEKCAIRLMGQILEAVAFLHDINILHMDIKNILLTDVLPDCDIKLCDLGLARSFQSGEDILEIIGTPDYVAPEVLDYEPLGTASDMWSVGVLTYVILTGCSPFSGDTKQETFLNISQINLDFPEDLFATVSQSAIDFIRKLLVSEPRERLTALECLAHKWLRPDQDETAMISRSSSTSCEDQTLISSSSSSSLERQISSNTPADDSPTSDYVSLVSANDDYDNAYCTTTNSLSISNPNIAGETESVPNQFRPSPDSELVCDESSLIPRPSDSCGVAESVVPADECSPDLESQLLSSTDFGKTIGLESSLENNESTRVSEFISTCSETVTISQCVTACDLVENDSVEQVVSPRKSAAIVEVMQLHDEFHTNRHSMLNLDDRGLRQKLSSSFELPSVRDLHLSSNHMLRFNRSDPTSTNQNAWFNSTGGGTSVDTGCITESKEIMV